MTRRLGPLLAGIAWLLAAAPPAAAQQTVRQELRESQLRLEQIREERAQLQREMERLRSRVHDVASELAVVERERSASARVLRELDLQSELVSLSIDSTKQQLLITGDRLAERELVLRQRLRSIYKRGPLHAVRVLLSARDFGDLLNRYKYLHLIALYDRMLVEDVTRLERDLEMHEAELERDLERYEQLRAEKRAELDQLRRIESRHATTLRNYRKQAQVTEGRLKQLEQDEARLKDVIAELERKRREEERRALAAGGTARAGSITTRDLGNLAWPVDGTVVYRFGPERRPNGVVLRNNGIGIGAPVGSPVRAVQAGTVVMARPFEGYGPTVMLSHGGGYYTLYLYLRDIQAREGQQVAEGEVIGTVGGERTPEGAHIEFQVRAPGTHGSPEPVDPLDWLRRRAGG